MKAMPVPRMRKNRFTVAMTVLAWGLISVAGNSVGAAQPRPNVIVILSDDQGWGDLSANGNTNLATPHIDSLAADGAKFDRFYVCPVCSPTRAEFLTGRYHPRSGVYSTSAGGERMDLDEATIADTFKAAGYATGAFGKWHNGMQYPYHPNGRGFEEYYGFCSGHWGNYFSPPLDHNGQIVRGKGFVIDDFTNHAIAFIEESHKSGKPFFMEDPQTWQPRLIFSHWRHRVSVRTQTHRLDHQGKLFDMMADPGQNRDISQQQPQPTRQLRKAASDWRETVLDGYDQDDRPFLIRHPDYHFTQIPARDGKAHGNIKRSNRWPNCSFFTNWTSTEDEITWDAEVLETGDYRVEIHYACPAKDVGSTIELTFNDSSIRGKILAPNDPLLRGMENDRVSRGESYVKDFMPMRLGTMSLEKG